MPAFAALVAFVVLPASANAYVYWTHGIEFGGGDAIGRANLDGTHVNRRFITGASFPLGVAVDAHHIYWAGGGRINRANLDGTGVNRRFIDAPGLAPTDVAVDAGHIYWANNHWLDTRTSTIGRANLNGTGVDLSFITGAVDLWGVAVDTGHVYWADFGTSTVGRANLNETHVNQSFINGAEPNDVAVDDGHVYWENYATSTIGRADLHGTHVNQRFIPTTDTPAGVAVDAGHVYWANYGTSTIGRASLNGTDVDQSFITDAGYPNGVGADALGPNPTPTTVSVSVKNTALVVAAGPGAKDNLQITRPSRFTFRITDSPSGAYTGSVVQAGAGCTRTGPYTANCPASGITPVLPVLVTSGGRGDKVVNSSGLPSTIFGEGGNDLLIGGSDGDILKGGPGVDVLKGLEGNDLLRANDGASDKLIDCGGGSDFGDLDLLPKDPKVTGCEKKARH